MSGPTGGKVLRWTGRALIGTGSLIVLVLAYQLWGTGFITSRHQNDLKHKFFAGVKRAGPAASPTPGTTLTVTAPGAVKPNLGTGIALLEIPKINLSMVVVEGGAVEDIKLRPAPHPGTPRPAETGNRE